MGKIVVVLNTLLYNWEEAIITEQLLHEFEFLKIRFLKNLFILLSAKKRVGGAAALMCEPPLVTVYFNC